MSDIIALRGVAKSYRGAPALSDIDLDLSPGAILALIGQSGSGKSTLLRLIAGLEAPDAGTIACGAEIWSSPHVRVPPEKRAIGVVFQDYALFPHLPAWRNVAFGFAPSDKPHHRERALGWLDRVGLKARADAFPHELSGGEQQRVALARALAQSPRAILLDEPFSGLDPVSRSELREMTRGALRESKAAALFVTHDADEALYLADRLAILREGRLIQNDAPETVYRHPSCPAAAAALGLVNLTPAQGLVGGVLHTPFGPIAAPPGLSGPAVGLVRAEGVLFPPQAERRALVVERRPMGAFDLLRIEAGGAAWRALSPRGRGPKPGEQAPVAIDPEAAFVFPASAIS